MIEVKSTFTTNIKKKPDPFAFNESFFSIEKNNEQ